MVSFMIFIVSLGVVMVIRSESDSLIENDYYEKGQTYDKDYQAKQNAVDDQVIPTIVTNDGLAITFPVPVKYQLICRRSSDQQLDKSFNGLIDENCRIKILKGELEPGPWLFRIQYTAEHKNYLFEGEIMMP